MRKQARKGPELAVRLERVGSVSGPLALISVKPPLRIPSTGASVSSLHALQGSEPCQAWGSARVSWPKLLLFVGEAIYSMFCYGISAGIQHSTARLRITNVRPHTTHFPCLPWIVVHLVSLALTRSMPDAQRTGARKIPTLNQSPTRPIYALQRLSQSTLPQL